MTKERTYSSPHNTFGSLAGQAGQIFIIAPVVHNMICTQAHGIGIPHGGCHRHGGVAVPDHIRLKLSQCQDLALGVDGKK